MASKPRYSAAPAVSKSTYVIGAMRNSADFPLLPGPVRVYIDGSFIGKSAIDCVSENERFELYLGLEQRIKVTRDLDSKKSAVSRSGSRRRLVAAYTISVRNYLTKPVELEVTDQVPVSQDSSVKVKVLAIEPRTEVPDKGIITWPGELPAEGGAELRFEFLVDYPDDVELPNAAAMEKWILAE